MKPSLIPFPTSVIPSTGNFVFSNATEISLEPSGELEALGNYLAEQLEEATGIRNMINSTSGDQNDGSIQLALAGDTGLGEEGYELSISTNAIKLSANRAAGLFYAIQTLRQLLPTHHVQNVSVPAVLIRDIPRFEWRGAMLDVARHFFGVEDIKRYIDLIAHYKMNRLHLHLTDDQGWRLEIKSWPKLTEIGAKTQVNGGGGGYYTQEQYKELVDYAQRRYTMIIPEIDTPGHTNAALASYPELNSSEEAPALYEGTQVGFSTLWINTEITYQFLDDVIRELAAITPTPYIHIGGDEARSTSEEDYKKFIKRIQEIVISHGKIAIGWSEIGEAEILPGTIAQHWFGAGYREAKRQGAKIILSPANKTYLDMKYDNASPLGLDWAALISVKDSYDWEPGSYMNELEESDILGIEAPLWSETLSIMKDIEYMAFPRIIGLAELAWSSKDRSWEEYKHRLAAHSKRMQAKEINFFRSSDVEWE